MNVKFLIPLTTLMIAGASFTGCMGDKNSSTNSTSNNTSNSTSTSISTSILPSISGSDSVSNSVLSSTSTDSSVSNSAKQRVRMMFVLQEEFDEMNSEEVDPSFSQSKNNLESKRRKHGHCHKKPVKDSGEENSAVESN